MKILIVMNDYFNQSNGISISAQRFAEELRKLGQEVRQRLKRYHFHPALHVISNGIPDAYVDEGRTGRKRQDSRTKRNRRCQAPAVF